MFNLTNRLDILPAKLPESTDLLQDDVDIRQIMHQGSLIQAANPKQGTRPAWNMAWRMWGGGEALHLHPLLSE